MASFIVYNTEGDILRTGACSNDDDIPLQAQNPGESVMTFVGNTEIEADPKTKKVVDGEIVEKT